MSNRNFIKGMKRRAGRGGHGRGQGAIADLVKSHEQSELDRQRGIERIRAERRIRGDSLDALAKRDRERSEQQRRKA